MLSDGVRYLEGSSIVNLVLPNFEADDKVNIQSPDPGEIIYQTTGTKGVYYYTGSSWVRLRASSDGQTIAISDLPAFTGDVESLPGTNVLTLNNITTAGSYTKVSVDAKGRVISGTSPTILSELGITDVYTKSYIDSLQTVKSINGKSGIILKLDVTDINGLASSATIDTTNASNITSGTLQRARLPLYTGDVISSALTSDLILKSVVSAGTYNKVQVNTKGLVVSGTQESTLAGLGITDAVGASMLPRGNATPAQLVLGNDTRLTDARTPKEHTHTVDQIVSLDETISNAIDLAQSTTNSQLALKEDKINKGAAGGYVGLNAEQKIDSIYLPSLTLNNVFTATTLEQRNALTANKSDIAIVAGSINKTFILQQLPASDSNNWLEMLNPTGGVTSVNAQTGAVSISLASLPGVLNLTSFPNSGVAAGLYNSISVDVKGRVTSGTFAPVYNKDEIDTKLSSKLDTITANVANGYASLDNQGKLNPSVLSNIALNNRYVVPSLQARNELVAAVGDIVIVTGNINKTYVLNVLPTSSNTNWLELLSSTGSVTSVNGYDGSINLSLSDIPGVLPISSFPVVSGDVLSQEGTAVIRLKDITTEGTYSKVTVNSKGLVVSGELTDASSLDATNITQGTLSDARLSSNVVLSTDQRLINARAPLPHTTDAITNFTAAVQGVVNTSVADLGNIVHTVNGEYGDVNITKTSIGLNHIDNTADINKPVSAAVAAELALKETPTNKGTAGGYVGLNSSTKIDSIYLPALPLSNRFVVESLSERNALTVSVGDIVVVADGVNNSYILNALPSTSDSNWIQLLTPASAVTSVNGNVGEIILDHDNIPGIVPTSKLPAFTGDAISSTGSNILSLTTSGVSPGTYNSVTVDAKGRVTAGSNINSGSSSFESGNASLLNVGQLPVARLPAFTGDVGAPAGTGQLYLSATGVVAGTYNSVTVDVKGRVLSGTNISIDVSNAANLTVGTLNKQRLPAFTGDVVSPIGTGNLTLTNTGVSAGTYNSVTVDTKGRVLSGVNTSMYSSTEVDAKLTAKIDASKINSPNGVVGLNANSKINPAYLPAVAINNRYVCETLNQRNLLNVVIGDIVIVAGSTNKSYILNALPADTNENWLEILNPTGGVQSFNGTVGEILFSANDLTGTVQPGTLPPFVGDVSSAGGTNQLTLRTVVQPGTYNRITVNEKGLVVDGHTVNYAADATQITEGTLADARLSSNVVLTNDVRLSDHRIPLPHTTDVITDFEAAVTDIISTSMVTSANSVTSVNSRLGDIVLSKADVNLSNVDNTSDANKPVSTAALAMLSLKEDKSRKNVAGGYVGLNDSGKIDTSLLPAMAINSRFAVSTLVQRNALSATVGDIAIVAGVINKSYILNELPPSVNNNWMELLAPTGSVTAVNNQTGNVEISLANISGNLPVTKMPALSGDISSISGTGTLTLVNTGVAAGTYNTVTVDKKGRVISGTLTSSVNNATTLNANNLTLGTVPIGRLPALIGDVVTTIGSNITTLSNTGVEPGTYTSVTVDNKGRVIAGTVSTSSATDASNLTSGTVPISRLPAFIGDVTSTVGTNSLVLNATGVAPGIYNSVTVDRKGRVTAGTSTSIYSSNEIDVKLQTKLDTNKLNQPNGYVGLNTNSKIDLQYLPSITLNENYVVNDLIERNATSASVGDIAIVLGYVNSSFMLTALPASDDNNWVELLNPSGGVLAVNGSTGTVSITLANIPGVLPANKLPVLTGDVSSVNDVVSLSSTGVSPGAYNLVTVDAKGRVTQGNNATTAAGLGITDVVNVNMLPSGDATSSQLVKGNDSRLTDSRNPTSHVHISSEISDLEDAITSAINNLKDGVDTQADTLKKLYELIIAGTTEIIVPNITARNALVISNTKTNVFVQDDGDGQWALYKAVTLGVNATYVKLSDPTIINDIVGFSAESSANKDADNTLSSNSDVKYPTQKAVKSYVDTVTATKVDGYALSTLLSEKASLLYVNNSLDSKASVEYVDTALTSKLNTSLLPVNDNASVYQIVMGNDTRLSDARAPLPHTTSLITNFDTSVSNLIADSVESAMLSYAGGVTSINSLTGDVTFNAASIGLSNVDDTSDINKPVSTAVAVALGSKESITNKNIAGGYVGLNNQGKIDSNYIPSMSINTKYVRETLAERNAVSTANIGDIVVVTGLVNSTYILSALPPSVDNNWFELTNTLGGVNTINGMSGTVSLSLSSLPGTLPAAKFPAFTGDVTSVVGSNVLSLAVTGVAPGTYNSVTVDAKGRVTAADVVSTTTVNASLLTTGTLAKERLPAFAGDVTASPGTGTLSLKPSGVSAGTYNSVTVDAKGRVTAGSIISVGSSNASDLTNGVLPVGRLPAFTGDVTSQPSTNSLVLSNTGVVADTYNSVTVDRKGRVLSGSKIPSYTAAQIDSALFTKLDITKANQPDGYVSLDSNSKIDQAFLPSITLNNRHVVTTLTERNALVANVGDVAIIAGEINKTYVLNLLPVSIDDNWLELVNPVETVTSLNGLTGVVSLTAGDLTGTLDHSVLPAFEGDVNSVEGSNILNLSNSGVTLGTYNTVTVNAKGIVTSAYNASTIEQLGLENVYNKIEIANLLHSKHDDSSELNASKLTSGTVSSTVLQDVVESGTYLTVTVDTKGRVIGGVTSTNTAAPGQVFVSLDAQTGEWQDVPSGTNASSLVTGTISVDRLPVSGAAAGNYGTVTIDSKGRVTGGVSSTNTASAGQVFVASNSTVGTWVDVPSSTDAGTLTEGELDPNRLPNTGISAGTYDMVSVDTKGRVVGAAVTNKLPVSVYRRNKTTTDHLVTVQMGETGFDVLPISVYKRNTVISSYNIIV
jgi:phage-related tail fiber protein